MNNTTIVIVCAVITSLGVVLAAILPTLLQNQNKKYREQAESAKRRLSTALDDIEYLYALLEEYEREQKDTFGSSLRRELSQRLLNEKSLSWSGKYSPSRIAYYRKNLNVKD